MAAYYSERSIVVVPVVPRDAKQMQLRVMSGPTPTTLTTPANRHALTAVEKQRLQL